MTNCFKILVYFYFTILIVGSLKSQTNKLKNIDFEDVKNQFYQMDSSSKNRFAQNFLLIGKTDKDSLRIANGYYLFSELYSESQKSITYADSIIEYTKKWNHYTYPAQGYIQKGTQQYYNSNYKKALQNFLKANDIALKQNNKLQLIIIKHYIGLLKNVNFNIKEALGIFKENYNYILNNDLQILNRKQYLKSLYALADSYAKNDVIDSAEIYYLKGIKHTSKKDNYFYPHFLLGNGTSNYLKRNYQKARDSLIKACSLLKEQNKGFSSGYLYLFEVYRDMGESNHGLKYLLELDSIYEKNENSDLFNERETYIFLNDYFKKNNDKEKQLKYLSRFLVVDSIINENYHNLDNEISKKYDSKMLSIEKESIIKSLKKSDRTKRKIIVLISLITSCCIVFIFIYNRKNQELKRKHKIVIKNEERTSLPSPSQLQKLNSSDLSEDLINRIITELNEFEKLGKFSTKNYTLNSLAKEINTNSTYLSKVINLTKGENFTNYMNNLKVEYAIQKLKNDSTIRSYTIKAISEECGFNTAQSFSKAFHKKTGIYPSYFVKKLNKELKT